TPVAAVQPVAGSARDAQTDAGQGQQTAGRRGGQGSAQRPDRAEAQAAPLLPYKPSGGDPDVRTDLENRALVRDDQKAAEEKEQAAQQRPALQEVLSSVWKASAAVVERVLGSSAASAPGGAVEAAAAVQTRALAPVQSELFAEPVALVEMPSAEQVVAYDEHGNSSLAPLEAGSLVSERV
ncbi:hypothetical protein, partial [Hydrogenophaga sp.]|uniref:hypothetical protein n=1 Tax=Hydrogenophaga sp. TaxID=1904254 RepID=UPI0035698304